VRAVAVALVLVLAACSGDDDGGDGPAADATTTDSDATTTTEAADPRDGEAVASLTVPVDVETPDDQVTIDVQSLTVEGATMVLRFSITPDFPSEDDSTAISLFDVYDRDAPGGFIQLIDRVNLKEYSVIYDPPNHWMSESTDVESVNGEPMFVFAVFAAPEDDIDVVDVTFRDNWPTLADVPLTR
jgi:hypothetical protein